MKKVIMTSLFALTFASAANAGAYMTGFASTWSDKEQVATGTKTENETKAFDQISMNVAVGYAFQNGLRIEADLFKTSLYTKDVEFLDQSKTTFGLDGVKGIFDIKTKSNVTPYVGVGVKEVEFTVPAEGSKGKRAFSFGALGVAGVSLAVNDKVALDLQYNREVDYDDNGRNVKSSYNGINVYKVGLRYNF